jgi:hypothetical protein
MTADRVDELRFRVAHLADVKAELTPKCVFIWTQALAELQCVLHRERLHATQLRKGGEKK